MMEAKVQPEKYLSKALTRNAERLLVNEGTILISCSGTIGNVSLCTRNFNDLAISQHAIRVIPHRKLDLGLLHAFAQSPAGQFLIKRSRSGSVVESIYEADVSSLLVPVLPRKLRNHLTELVQRVSTLRSDGNALLDRAEAEVQRQSGLPNIADVGGNQRFGSLSSAQIFNLDSGEIFARENQFGSVRLDATYYDRTATKVRTMILEAGGKELGSVLLGVRNSRLRKRLYVDDPSDGVPMIGGKQLMQVRPSDVNYLSKALTRNLQEETVRTGWTLVSCGGTLGRTLFVHRNFEGWALSQHVMRLLPDESQVWPGYLYAFVASPYGQIQVAQRAYGSVIPELRDFQFESIAIAVPRDRGQAVHDIVVRAFDCRADALARENEAIRLFEAAIEDGRDATEEKWGREY
jgi:type I restriction enzyme S subunit